MKPDTTSRQIANLQALARKLESDIVALKNSKRQLEQALVLANAKARSFGAAPRHFVRPVC